MASTIVASLEGQLWDNREMIPTIIGVVSGYQASHEPVYRESKTELTVQVNTGLLVLPIPLTMQSKPLRKIRQATALGRNHSRGWYQYESTVHTLEDGFPVATEK